MTNFISRLPLIVLTGWLTLAVSAPAQETWEYSPYKIRVWVAMRPSTELSPDYLPGQLVAALTQQADIVTGAAWELGIEPCPQNLEFDASHHLGKMNVEQILAADEKLLETDDKLIILNVGPEIDGWRAEARELDCRTRQWRPMAVRRTPNLELLSYQAFAAMTETFAPILRIETVDGKEAVARIRAGGLVMRRANPAHVANSDLLLPVLRRNDRRGKPLKGGIQPAAWTFMTIEGRERSQVKCLIHSGIRTILGGRSSSRTKRFALAVNPRGKTTWLKVMENVKEDPQPLGGYEIHTKDPFTEETEYLGRTDWRGRIEIPLSKNIPRLVYVRNGGRLLARLPIAPGLEPELIAKVGNDDMRLQAEGYVKGVQNRLMDLVARRELYTNRFRNYLKNKEYEKAEELLSAFRRLDSSKDVERDIDQMRAQFGSADKRTKTHIDEMFNDTKKLVQKFIDPRRVEELASELRAQRKR